MNRLVRSVAFLLCILLSGHDLFAQDQIPHGMTMEEKMVLAEYLKEKHEYALRSIPIPPPGQVRTMAEWEEIQALVITWSGQQTILGEITRHAVKECKVLIITNSPGNVSTFLTQAGIPLDSVEFITTPYNSIWIRDYGPWTVYQKDVDSLWIVDWIYNRPRANDDATPTAVAQHLHLPIYEATAAPYDWIHTGGNHLPDGMGTAFSSLLVLEENPGKTEAQVDSIANLFLGVQSYIKFPTLPYDGIHHLDMHMRVIDEETIIFGEYPEGVSDGPQIESNINYLLEEHTTSFGNPFRIERLPMPPDQNGRYPSQGGHYRTYTNSIFLNKTILVPTYEERYDTTALRIYRELLPGYNVVGINCNSIIPSLGALHCITKTVGHEEPLWIAHSRLRDSEDPASEYPVIAVIKHRTGIHEANLFYRSLPDTVYTMTSMILVDTLANIWGAIIPPYSAGTEIQYYIHATAHSGKQQVRPIVAPEGYFQFKIKGEEENKPPYVTILQPPDGSIFALGTESIVIEFSAEDTDGHINHTTIHINNEPITTLVAPPFTYEWQVEQVGMYSIVVVATDDDGAVTSSDTVHVTLEGITNANPIVAFEDVKAFPNPVSGVLNLSWENESLKQPTLTVMNTLGQSIEVLHAIDKDFAEVDFSGLPAGLYIVQLFDGNKMSGVKVIKF